MKNFIRLISFLFLISSGGNTFAFSVWAQEEFPLQKQVDLSEDLGVKVNDPVDFSVSGAAEPKLLEPTDFLSADFKFVSAHKNLRTARIVQLSERILLQFASPDIAYPFHTFL